MVIGASRFNLFKGGTIRCKSFESLQKFCGGLYIAFAALLRLACLGVWMIKISRVSYNLKKEMVVSEFVYS